MFEDNIPKTLQIYSKKAKKKVDLSRSEESETIEGILLARDLEITYNNKTKIEVSTSENKKK